MKLNNKIYFFVLLMTFISNSFADCNSLRKAERDFQSGRLTSETFTNIIVDSSNNLRDFLEIKLSWLDSRAKDDLSFYGNKVSRSSWNSIETNLIYFNIQADCIKEQSDLVTSFATQARQSRCIYTQTYPSFRYSYAQKYDKLLHSGSMSNLMRATLKNDIVLSCLIE